MAQKNRTTLKGYFEVGDIPNQNQYADLIDSFVTLQDNNSGSINLTGNINLLGTNGNLTASQNISASGNVYAASFEPNLVTSGIISQSATTGTSSLGTEIVLDNDVFLQGRDLGGTARDLVSLDSSNANIIGNTAYATTLRGGGVTVSSTNDMTLDAGDDILIKDNGVTSVFINTNKGNITASGDLLVSGSVSSSAVLVGNSFTPTASLHTSGAASQIIFENLPITKPSITGSLWLSGSAGSDSKYLVVFTG